MSVQKQDNGRWRARWRGPDGRERARVFDTKREARAWEDEQRRDVRRGSWVDPAGGQVTVRVYATRWLAVQAWAPSTRDRTVSVLDVHVLPTFGDRPLASIRPSEVRAWIAQMTAAGLKPRTVEANFHVLRQMMRAAVVDQVLVSNPCEGARLPRKERRLVVPLEYEQVEALADTIRPDLTAAVWLAAGCGLRQGEVLGVTVDRVNWLRREIVVDRQMLTPSRGAPMFGPTKTEASNRIVPAPARVLEILSAHLEAFGEGPDRLVFHMDGVPWRRNRVNQVWRNAKRAAGVEARFHDLRHYCASSLIRSGVSVKGVQEVLGHATPVETLEVYSHLWPADRDRAREAMGDALSADRESSADSARTVRPLG